MTEDAESIVGRVVVDSGRRWEVLTEPAYPSYGGEHQYVWVKFLGYLPKSGRGRPRKNRQLRDTILMLPLEFE